MSEQTSVKQCNKCGTSKPLEDFQRRPARPDGRGTQCHACRSAYQRARYAKNRDERLAKARARYAAEDAEARASRLERERAWRESNRDASKAIKARYRDGHREEIAASTRKYWSENAERFSERAAAYRQQNPHVGWIGDYRARCRKLDLAPIVEDFTRLDVIERWGDSCVYCETGAFEQLDHYVPVSGGGPHTLANVRPSCAACNSAKHSTPGDEWVRVAS